MSKTQTQHYVLKIDDTSYWMGYNNVTDQIRKARMYNSIKHAKNDGVAGILRCFKHPVKIEILTVEIVVIKSDPVTEEDIENARTNW